MITSVMKHLTAIALPVAIVAVASFLMAGFRSEAATITWTNTFDASGQFHYINNVNPAKPWQFSIFKMP